MMIAHLWVGMLLVIASGGAGPITAYQPAPPQASTGVAILLAPAVAEVAAAAQARRVFFSATETVDLSTDAVVLASSPDGSGALCTDDEARLTIVRDAVVVARWSHRFWSADRRAIVCLPPPQLAIPTGPGRYEVRIELEDRYPPTYSTRAYYLVVLSPVPTPVAEVLIPPTATSEDEQRVSSAPARTAQHTMPHAATSAPTTTALPAPSPRVSTAAPSATTTSRPSRSAWALLGSGLLAALVAVPYVIRQHRARQRALRSSVSGIVYLYDQETREAHTAVFDGRAPRLILRRPLELISDTEVHPDRMVGAIQPSDHAPCLLDGRDAEVQATPLHPDRIGTLAGGAVTVHFRAAARSPQDNAWQRGRL